MPPVRGDRHCRGVREPDTEEHIVESALITQPFILSPKEGKAIWHMGVLMHFKAVGEDTGGAFWLAEASAAMGAGPPMHIHAHEDELWYVLDGEVSFYVGDDVATV